MRPLTLADIFETKTLSDAQVSPDGQLVAFVVSDQYKDGTKSPKSQIWIVNSDGSGCRPFTTGPRTDHSPRWSPYGEWLAFLSDRMNEDGKDELFLLSRQGGEARRLFEAKSGVGGEARAHPFAWSPNGSHISFLQSVWSDRGVVSGDLHLIPSSGGAPRNLSAGYDASVSWMAWMPNGKSLIALAVKHDGAVVEQWPVGSGKHRQLWSGS